MVNKKEIFVVLVLMFFTLILVSGVSADIIGTGYDTRCLNYKYTGEAYPTNNWGCDNRDAFCHQQCNAPAGASGFVGGPYDVGDYISVEPGHKCGIFTCVCYNFANGNICGTMDCDYLDTVCIDYFDVNYECSKGQCITPSCGKVAYTTSVCGTKDCDYLDTDCRDYHDVSRYCSSGSCGSASCGPYTDKPLDTPCSIGACDGAGNCIIIAPILTKLSWTDLDLNNIIESDLKDSVKLTVSGTGLTDETIDYKIYKDGFLWFSDSKVAETSTEDSLTWEAGEKNDGTFSSGNYYFTVAVSESEYDSRDYDYGTLTVLDPTYAYWADENKNIINDLEGVLWEVSVLMILKNTELSEDAEVSFEIYEKDLVFDDLIKTMTGIVDSQGDAEASWTITQDDLDATGEKNFDDFYFTANGEASNNLIITIVEALVNCVSIDFCMNYETQSTCESDTCEVGADSVKENNPEILCGEEIDNGKCFENTTCGCSWDEINGCSPDYEIEMTCYDGNGPETPLTIGECSYEEDTDDDCEDGFLSYSWEGNWIWGEDNVFLSNPDGDDYAEEPAGEWHYDPYDNSGVRISEKCADGNNIIPCPAQIQLPFFGVYSLVIAIAIIILIYILISKKKHKRK